MEFENEERSDANRMFCRNVSETTSVGLREYQEEAISQNPLKLARINLSLSCFRECRIL